MKNFKMKIKRQSLKHSNLYELVDRIRILHSILSTISYKLYFVVCHFIFKNFHMDAKILATKEILTNLEYSILIHP